MILAERALAELADIGHGFFGRTGGVSEGPFASLNMGLRGGDDRERVLANRAIAVRLLDAAPERLVTARQVHGTECLTVSRPWDPLDPPEADALVSRTPGLVLGVLTADCAPILLADAAAGVIGVAHAGWRGALGGIVDVTLRRMVEAGAALERIVSAVGPCIGPASYEVGHDYRDRFVAEDAAARTCFVDHGEGARPFFDLAAYCGLRLRRAGVVAVATLERDTCALPELFFSHRRSSKLEDRRFGLQLSAIVLR